MNRLNPSAVLFAVILLSGCTDAVEPDPLPTRVVELGPDRVQVDVGSFAAVEVTVYDEDDTVTEAPTEWVVRDSAVAEVFGYESAGHPRAPIIYGSTAGSTWVVVQSGSASDSVQVDVATGEPLGLNEALIEVSGRWTRRYRVPVWQAVMSDRLLDPREVGDVSTQGAVGDIPEHDGDQITDGFWVLLRDDSLEAGARTLGERQTGASMAYVFVQAAWWYQYGPIGPNNQIYLSDESTSTFTIDSVQSRPLASPILYGTLAMNSVMQYRAVLSDLDLSYVETGRLHDVTVQFATEVDVQPISEAVIEVLQGPLAVTDSAEYTYLFSVGDSVRANFHFLALEAFDLDLFLQVHHDRYTPGSYALGREEATQLVGRWAANSPDELSFQAETGIFEITERRERQRGYPPILRGTLEAVGPLTDTAGVAVDTLSFRLEFAMADSLDFELDSTLRR